VKGRCVGKWWERRKTLQYFSMHRYAALFWSASNEVEENDFFYKIKFRL
jgi:hypothetical protein